MTAIERLRSFVAAAPAGTLVPVEALAEILKANGGPAGCVALDDLSLKDAAQLVGRAESTLRNWCVAGKVPDAYKLNGRDWRIPRLALRRFLDGQSCEHRRGATSARETGGDMAAWRRHMER